MSYAVKSKYVLLGAKLTSIDGLGGFIVNINGELRLITDTGLEVILDMPKLSQDEEVDRAYSEFNNERYITLDLHIIEHTTKFALGARGAKLKRVQVLVTEGESSEPLNSLDVMDDVMVARIKERVEVYSGKAAKIIYNSGLTGTQIRIRVNDNYIIILVREIVYNTSIEMVRIHNKKGEMLFKCYDSELTTNRRDDGRTCEKITGPYNITIGHKTIRVSKDRVYLPGKIIPLRVGK